MLEEIVKTVGAVLLTYTAHYATTKIYSSVCIPDGFWGYMQGFLTTGSPLCSATLNYAATTQNSYATIVTMTVSRLLIEALAMGSGVPIPKPG